MHQVRFRATEPGGVKRFLAAGVVIQTQLGEACTAPASRAPQSFDFLSQTGGRVQELLVRQHKPASAA